MYARNAGYVVLGTRTGKYPIVFVGELGGDGTVYNPGQYRPASLFKKRPTASKAARLSRLRDVREKAPEYACDYMVVAVR